MAGSALFAASWLASGIPSFEWQAALIVGAIVLVGAAIVLTGGIATPFIAIQAGATLKGTALAIAGISAATAVVAGVAAGLYWGREGDTKYREKVDQIARVSNQLDVYFEPSAGDSKRAAEFTCTLVVYEETDLRSRPPTITTRRISIKGDGARDFFDQVEQQLKEWLAKPVEGDRRGEPRRVVVYMNPFPGEGAYDRIREVAERPGVVRCVVQRNEGRWSSALPK